MAESLTLHEKLVLIQSELKVPKGQNNDFGGFKYRNLEDIENQVKPFLSKHGLTLVLSDEMVEVGSRIYVKATATLQDGKESIFNTAYAREAEAKKGMDDSQLTGATSSYARKYAASGLFLIDNTADADSHDNRDYTPAPKRTMAPVEEAPSESQINLAKTLMNERGYEKLDAVALSKRLIGKNVPTTKLEYSDLIKKLLVEPHKSEADKMPDLSE